MVFFKNVPCPGLGGRQTSAWRSKWHLKTSCSMYSFYPLSCIVWERYTVHPTHRSEDMWKRYTHIVFLCVLSYYPIQRSHQYINGTLDASDPGEAAQELEHPATKFWRAACRPGSKRAPSEFPSILLNKADHLQKLWPKKHGIQKIQKELVFFP